MDPFNNATLHEEMGIKKIHSALVSSRNLVLFSEATNLAALNIRDPS